MTDGILIGGSASGQIFLNPRYANRHGLVAGATGTGKTVTLQCLAEGFSEIRQLVQAGGFKVIEAIRGGGGV